MKNLFPKRIRLKSGETLVIRVAERSDALALIKYLNIIGGESDFFTFGRGEFKKSIDEEEAILEEYIRQPNQIYLIGQIGNKIVCQMSINASPKPRLQHIGTLGISVSKSHWGKGIGAYILQSSLDWAKRSKIIRKVNLVVVSNNEKAMRLYKKLGFEIEGQIIRDFYINGQFYDSYAMGILID